MFCKNCGTPVPDGVSFCPQCGTPTGMNPAGAAGGQKNTAYGAKKRPYLAIGLIAVLAVAAIILIVFLGRLIFGGGYKKPIKTFVQGMEEEDGEKILSAFSKKTVDELEDMSGLDKRDFEREYDDFIQIFTDEDLDGEDIKLKYKIEDSEKLNKDDIKDIRDELKDSLGVREDISAAREVDIVLTIYIDDEEEDKVDVSMDVIKVDGKWYINYGSIYID